MKQRNGLSTPFYTEAQSRRWLCWLARSMAAHGQTVFLIEQIQPSWLATRWQRWAYVLASRLLWGFLAGMAFGLVFGLAVALAANLIETLDRTPDGLSPGDLQLVLAVALIVGLLGGLLGGPVSGLLLGIGDVTRLGSLPAKAERGGRATAQQFATDYLVAGLCASLVALLLDALLVKGSNGVANRLIYSLLYGLAFGLFLGPLRTVYGGRPPATSVRTVETVTWSWTAALLGTRHAVIVAAGIALVCTLVSGLVFACMFALSTKISGEPGIRLLLAQYFQSGLGFIVGFIFGVVFGLAFGLFFGLLCGLILGFGGGFRPGVRALKTQPNQGIRLSARSGVLMGAVAGMIAALGTGVLAGPAYGALFGVLGGLCSALWYGGLDVLQHGILRVLLAVRGDAPLNYAHFLDYAAGELNFLQKVGGGYIFVHRYLLEYFADEHAVGKLH